MTPALQNETQTRTMTITAHSRRALLRASLRLGGGMAVGALLAACGGDGSRSMLSPPPSAPSGRRQGSVRIGMTAASGDPVGLSDAVYSRLVALDPRTGKVHGDLARGFEVTNDGLTATVRLRDGLRFHADKDGLASALTAEGVRRDFAVRGQTGDYLFASVVDRVEAPDQQTVVLRMRAPFSLLFDYLADVQTGGVRAATATYAVTGALLGSGPFVPVAREEAGTALVANPLYHRSELPLLERVQVLAGGPSRDPAAAVTRGELEVALHTAGSTEQESGTPQADIAATALRRTSRRMRGLGFSLAPQKGGGSQARAVPAMRDARVRQAVSLALDRKALAALEGGVLSGPVSPAHRTDAIPESELAKHPLYQHNPGEAKQLLEAAGQRELSFALEGANRPVTRAMAQLIERQLREAGFVPRVRLLPAADWEVLFLAGDFEGALVEFDEMRTPDIGLRLHLSGGLPGNFSLWGFSSPKYDAEARKAFAEIDPVRRGERARAAQRVLFDEVPAMFPLSAPPDYATVASTLRGYAFDAFEFNAAWLASEWRVEPKR